MSFALSVKTEIINNKKNKKECEAFLFGMLLTTKFEDGLIRFSTSINEVGEYFVFVLKKIFGDVEYTIENESSNISTNLHYIVKDNNYIISNHYDLTNIHSNYKDIINNDKKLLGHCIAGNFVVRGSVNDPHTSSYHLEFLCANMASAIYLQKMINDYDLNCKIAKRRERLIVYIKESEKIVDLIRIMDASKSAFDYDEIIINRNFTNSINRRINCDVANEQKAIKAGLEQLKYIEYLEFNYPLEKLDPKLLLVMKVRKENEDATLIELVEIIKDKYEIVISKPGLSHRFSKIKEIALEHQKGREK
ncbi:MAG: DNA-binding protein WhiA [bacterium]